MTTVRELIEGSLRLIEELGAGQVSDADSANDALKSLSMMINSWSSMGDLIYTETTDSYAMTAGDGVYTIGATGDIAVARPTRITAAYVTSGGVDSPLEIIDAKKYADIPIKTLQGIPEQIYFESNYPNATLRLYPVPSAADTLVLYSEKPLTEYTALTTTLSLPPGYERALKYNLAVEIAPEYGKQASATVQKIAIQSKNAIQNNNNRYDSEKLVADPALIATGTFNIYTGE